MIGGEVLCLEGLKGSSGCLWPNCFLEWIAEEVGSGSFRKRVLYRIS